MESVLIGPKFFIKIGDHISVNGHGRLFDTITTGVVSKINCEQGTCMISSDDGGFIDIPFDQIDDRLSCVLVSKID